MKKVVLSVAGALLLTGISSPFLTDGAKAETNQAKNSNAQSENASKNFKDIPRPDTKYWNKEIKDNGDEEYTASDSQVYRELRDKGQIKKDPELESMLQNRAKGGQNKYVVHKDGTATIYLSNKWASRVAAGETGLIIALMGGGPYGAVLAPLISGAVGDHIPKSGLKIHVVMSGTPVVKSVKPQ
ncbi:hypothetical protein D0399_12245 [Staphylococcus epidermidis]|uniref:hypothetical protein n=1 Tax=Staphylococcus epidermidis TaxID=1282 RepID=UPI00193240A3|nr:hypothetical protein [Staphylococcus epidermidis]MBM0801012.1 hypothetical protein [Staphylococcus epidermidis]